jgi:hypothetical protein
MPPLNGDSIVPRTAGVTGQGQQFHGIVGNTTAFGQAGVAGFSDTDVGHGVFGHSKNGNGVFGIAMPVVAQVSSASAS